MRPKVIAWIFLVLLFVPVSAVFTVLKFQQKQVRRDVKWKLIAGVDKHELVFFKFSVQQVSSELDWKHSKEFRFRGEFYDIVEQENHGDSLSYWCWWDRKETELYQQFEQVLAGYHSKNPIHKNKQKIAQQLFKNLFLETKVELVFSAFEIEVSSVLYPEFIFHSGHNNNPISPPPELTV